MKLTKNTVNKKIFVNIFLFVILALIGCKGKNPNALQDRKKTGYIFESGLKYRIDTFYYNNGGIEAIYKYMGKIQHGKQLTFHQNGQINTIIYYKNGLVISYFKFYKNGNKYQILHNNYDGIPDSISLIYDKQGEIKSQGYFKNGILFGEWQEFD